MIKLASVEAMICSTVTPGARSNSLKPFGVISSIASSVTTFWKINWSFQLLIIRRIFQFVQRYLMRNYTL